MAYSLIPGTSWIGCLFLRYTSHWFDAFVLPRYSNHYHKLKLCTIMVEHINLINIYICLLRSNHTACVEDKNGSHHPAREK